METAGQRLRAELVNVEAQQARLAAQRKELIVRETECRRRRLELLRKVQSSPSLQVSHIFIHAFVLVLFLLQHLLTGS